jgi:RNA polymerase sigma factor (sigma-70 family)
MNDTGWIQAALERHEGALIAFALRITGDLDSARDVVQETYLKLCAERREAVEPHLREWLFTVCRNAALDLQRQHRRGRRAEMDDMDRHDSGTSATQALETKDESARALRFLARLPRAQQEVLRLRFQSGLSYKEIASVTGQSMGNVGWLIHTGLKSLRAQLAGDAVEGMVS